MNLTFYFPFPRPITSLTRDFRKPQWRHQRWCELKNEFKFFLWILRHFWVIYSFIIDKTKSETWQKFLKISHCSLRSPDNSIQSSTHFMLLPCKGRQRNVPRITTHVHSHCTAPSFTCSVTSPLQLPWWFCKLPSGK